MEVKAYLTGSYESPREIQEWIEEWIVENSEWSFFGNDYNFYDFFSNAPIVKLNESIVITFKCVNNVDNFWKDWFVRVIKEMTDKFPQLGKIEKVEKNERPNT